MRLFNTLPHAVDAPYDSPRAGALSICFEGTRVSILDKVIDWMKKPELETPQIFCVNGMAGIEKSTLACIACRRAALL